MPNEFRKRLIRSLVLIGQVAATGEEERKLGEEIDKYIKTKEAADDLMFKEYMMKDIQWDECLYHDAKSSKTLRIKPKDYLKKKKALRRAQKQARRKH